MPNYEVNFFLANGGKATIKMENVNETAPQLETAIQTQMNEPDNDFHLSNNTVVVRLRKTDIVGYTIDSLA